MTKRSCLVPGGTPASSKAGDIFSQAGIPAQEKRAVNALAWPGTATAANPITAATHGNDVFSIATPPFADAIERTCRPVFSYAYISALEYYCFGLTEDGCLLNWDEVETLKGDLISQCVAYGPWQDY